MVVALLAGIPAMVVRDVAAAAFPAPGVILSAGVIRLDPIRAGVWRPGPVAVVPRVLRTLRILIALDPDVVGARPRRHDVGVRRRRFADVDAEGDLRARGCGGS